MANANKRKGDAAERKVRDLAHARYPGSFKTRAGFNDDLGDVITEHPAGRVVLQVKDVATPTWTAWFAQVAEQVATCARESNRDVLGGLIVHKARGVGDPAKWRAVAELGTVLDLIDAAYEAGRVDGADGALDTVNYLRPPR